MRILVGEGNPLTRALISETLQAWGHAVEERSNGEDVWRALASDGPPQVAIVGSRLPGMSGLDICKQLAASPRSAACYLLLIVPRDSQSEGLQALEAGADDYISQPLNLGELKARIGVAARIVDMNMDRVERETAHYVEQLEQAVAQLQESRSRIVSVQETLRGDIAADLHGHVQTEMSLLYLKLLGIKEEIQPASDKIAEEIEQVAEELDSLRENAIRKLSHKLYPSKVRLGLAPGLRSLVDRHSGALAVQLDVADAVLEMEPAGDSRIRFEVRLALYRIAEEALANVVAHAQTGSASMRVWLLDASRSLCIAIEDGGRGFDPNQRCGGLGLATMSDYVGAIGGVFHLRSAPGQGTTITVTVPLDPQRE